MITRQKHDILLITATEGRRIHLRRLLEQAGYGVQTVISPREAVHLLMQQGSRRQNIAVILVDQISLGTEARALVSAFAQADIAVPTVVLGVLGAADDVIGCLRAGAADYISLPAGPAEVLDVLTRAMSAPIII